MAETRKKLTTPKGRLSFVNIFETRENDNGRKLYDTAFIVPKPETITDDPAYKAEVEKFIADLKAIVKEAATAKWGDKLPAGLIHPLKSGDEGAKADYDGYGAGVYCFNASSGEKFPPAVVGLQRDGAGQFIRLEPKDVYSGCYARLSISAYAYDNKKKGVSLNLHAVQKLADGESLGGSGVNVDEAFGSPAAGIDGVESAGETVPQSAFD